MGSTYRSLDRSVPERTTCFLAPENMKTLRRRKQQPHETAVIIVHAELTITLALVLALAGE